MKKNFSSIIVLLSFLLVLSSCTTPSEKTDPETSAIPETQPAVTLENQETAPPVYDTTIAVVPDTTAAVETTAITEVQTTILVETTVAPEIHTTAMVETAVTPQTQATEAVTVPATETQPSVTEAVKDDVTTWDTEKIVEFYKNAAAATGTSVKSQQTVGLQDISVNNGQLDGVFSFVTPILSSFLSSSVTETDGITGDFMKLTAEDVSSARAYESSKGTVVEITLNGQTNNATENTADGSVAHGIYVVGDLPSIMGQLNEKGLPIEISLDKTVLTYTQPVIKAVVGADGKIVNGTWSCTVEISLSDYKFAGSTVNSTRVVLDNKIVVSGGFNP